MATWIEQLRDPRWQRRRLDILQRANFSCEYCGRADLPLHVHHGLYHKGHAPWQYADDELKSLCEECHRDEHALREVLKQWLCCMNLNQISELYECAAHILYGQNQNH